MSQIEILEELIELREIIENYPLSEEIKVKDEYNELVKKLKIYTLFLEYEDPQDVIDVMIKKFNYPEDFAISKTRERDRYVYPRQIAIAICKYLSKNKNNNFKKITLVNIGSYFGKDHATVLHSCKTVKNMCDTDKKYKAEFENITFQMLGVRNIFD